MSTCFVGNVPARALVGIMAADGLPDYAAVRAHAASLVPRVPTTEPAPGLLPALPVDGEYRYSASGTY